MAAKARSLYTLPAVAMEVVELSNCESVDTDALKRCIERDPALAAKLLRVVNSSLFGLSGKVDNLTQAIALLGHKPLRLLVLGFSLPERLLADLEAEQLAQYWRRALTRAIAARNLAQQFWKTTGDDVFLAALLEDIGMLVLMQQVGTPYARFAQQVRAERGRLVDLERHALGFDHRELTLVLMRSWRMPATYVAAIAAPPKRTFTADAYDAQQSPPQVLHLANLLADLVDEHQLPVLPELLECGATYCGLTKDDLDRLVAELAPQVDALADVLQLDLEGEADYDRILAEAHRSLTGASEDAAVELARSEDALCAQLLTDSRELRAAVDEFVAHPATPANESTLRGDAAQHAPQRPLTRAIVTAPATRDARLSAALEHAAAECRLARLPLAVGWLEIAAEDPAADVDPAPLDAAIERVLLEYDLNSQHTIPLESGGIVFVLPRIERREAVELASRVADLVERDESAGSQCVVKAGIAAIAVVPKGFESQRLLEAAQRCLDAARAVGGSATKSIEVY